MMEKHRWRPIPGCPGRYVLKGGPQAVSPRDLIGADVIIERFDREAADDIVLVVFVDGGGLLSYAKDDGGFVHTLNTQEGLRRKLKELGIDR
jgi:hypothetical protein